MKPLEHAGRKYTNADAWRTAKRTVNPLRAPQTPQAGPMPPHERETTHKASPVAMSHAPEGGPSSGQVGEDGMEQDGSQVAAEHGPANMVAVEHEHEIGVHHVHSAHPDGHEHHSDHESAEKAHEHAAKLAGAHGEPDGDEGSPDDWDQDND